MIKGIDVSSYQGRVDWSKVKPYIDFAIIRCGWGNDTTRQDDLYYERNAEECARLNIPFGVYLYSYATTLDDARSEVAHTLRLIKDKKLLYPVYLDVESKRQMNMRKDDLIEIVKYYCEEMEKNGYYVGIYANLNTLRNNLDSTELDPFDKWVAEWNDRFTYNKEAGMWQHTSYEELPGIRGRVDGDIAFKNYPKIITDAGLNHLQDSKLQYRKGEKIFVTGDIYDNVDANKITTSVCDKEFTIEETFEGKNAPYKIDAGYVKAEEVYQKK